MTNIIEIKNLTKKFSNGYGVFDISLNIQQGQIYGYLGPNGAGKSTTIRNLMGYTKPNKGEVKIFNKNCWTQSQIIQPNVGYLPGEIALPEFMNGIDFIKMIFNLRKQKDWKYVEQLIEYWEFNPNIKIKKMSKGMKQKVGLVIAFMHKPKLLILDEPTTGLDPLMQEKFIKLIQQEKKSGTTVLMSSHIFSEIEQTCDQVAIIKSGRIVADFDLEELKSKHDRYYEIEFKADKLMNSRFLKSKLAKDKGYYIVPSSNVPGFFTSLKKYNIKNFKEIPFSLEKYFLNFYKRDGGEVNV